MGYDDVIERMGKFGRYQRRIFLVMYLPFIVSSFHKMGGVFLSARADFRCLIPGENPDTAIYELPPNITNNLTSIWDPKTKKYPRCEINDPNQLIDSNQTSGRNDSSPIPTIKCDSFVYDTSTYTRTATTEVSRTLKLFGITHKVPSSFCFDDICHRSCKTVSLNTCSKIFPQFLHEVVIVPHNFYPARRSHPDLQWHL